MECDSFTVLNLTDPQLNECHWDPGDPGYDNAYAVLNHTVRTLIDRIKPDLITITGGHILMVLVAPDNAPGNPEGIHIFCEGRVSLRLIRHVVQMSMTGNHIPVIAISLIAVNAPSS